ncbi:MAG: shikimate kinase [Deltaproteobacteria bacterium]|nr:shikimate kinase [Deltaproteobacteria bacterium]
MNLALVGYRGTGKSVIASQLGQLLNLNVISLDREIANEAGMTIPEIVAKHGWVNFRDLEEKICAQYALKDGLVIDCGGGIIERESNIAILKQNCIVFWLKAEISTIASRIADDTQRPSLTGAKSFIEEIKEVLARRIPLYRKIAHVEIATDNQSINDLALTITNHFRYAKDNIEKYK